MAWSLAALPPALALAERVPDAMGAPVWLQACLLVAGGAGYACLLRGDMAAVTAARPGMPRGASNLLVPLYLWRRGAALGRGRIASAAWAIGLAISLSVSPVRVRFGGHAGGGLPACDAPEIRAVLPGYAARDGDVSGRLAGTPVEIPSRSPGVRRCVAVLRVGEAPYSYVYEMAPAGADVMLSGTVEAMPDR